MRNAVFNLASVLMVAAAVYSAVAQQAPAAQVAPIERRDPALDAAANEIGRALFLRCFCAEDKLSFDVQGRLPTGSRPKTVDWTLAGINVQKVERKAQNAIELDGVRVAIRYAADRHEFERHPQKDEAMQVIVADNGDPAAFERALQAVFALGIDRPLQKSMPEYWQHYFEPGLAWPAGSADALTGQTIYNVGQQVPATGSAAPPVGSGAPPANGSPIVSGPVVSAPVVSAPVVTRRADANYTSIAARDHIKGPVRLRMVVDAEGIPRRISVALPLGYGLDEEAVKAAAKMRFSPALLNSQPVDANMTVDQQFVLTPQPPAR